MKKTVIFPLTRPHCGLPMANGQFGVLVWGTDSLNLTINHTKLWDHRNGEAILEGTHYSDLVAYAAQHGCDKGLGQLILKEDKPQTAFRPQRLPVGRFELQFRNGLRPATGELDYDSGCFTVRLSNGTELTLDLDLHQDQLLVADPGNSIAGIQCRPAWDFPKSREWMTTYNIPEPQRLPDGWTVLCPNPDDKPFTFRCAKTAFGYQVFTGNQAPDADLDAVRKANRTWWSSFQSKRTRIHVPDEPFWEEFFDFSAYKLAAATCPFGFPGGLQGPWHEEYQHAQWSGDYHFNVNMQMIYGPLCAMGAHENLLPLFDMLESRPYQDTLRNNAKFLLGVEDGLYMLHALDDLGMQCGWMSPGACLDPACGAWTALLYYDYYRYTNDLAFLKDRAFPFIRRVMRCYEAMLDKDFNIPVAISAEYASSNGNMSTVAGANPSYQLAAIRKLARILQECSLALKRQPEPIWQKILDKVPEFSLVYGYDSYSQAMEPRIGIWDGQDLEVCHRHHSHLGCIWPFDSLQYPLSPETSAILDNSIDHWISMGFGKWSEWCIPWAAIIFSRMRLHEAPMQLFRIWKDLFLNEGMATVYLPRFRSLIAHRRHDIDKPKDDSEVMQMDGTGGFLSAFMEMCADTRFPQPLPFPGMPDAWQEISFENLRLPGGKSLSGNRRDGFDTTLL